VSDPDRASDGAQRDVADPALPHDLSKIEFRGTLVCSINVSDLDRSVRWYRDGLGFEEIYRMDDYGWCEMRSPINGVTIGLQRAESGFGPGGATLSFTVADIEAARKHLQSATLLTG
jgi:catechol 2,3-dioxygenase-like lactoylglutathione lyase family enzyme